MSNRRSEGKRRRFLEALERGSSVSEAASYAGLARATVYLWRERDAGFAEDWDAAELRALGDLRRKAYELAMGGNTRLLVWLIERGDHREGERDGEVVGEIQIVGLKEGERYDGEFIQFVDKG